MKRASQKNRKLRRKIRNGIVLIGIVVTIGLVGILWLNTMPDDASYTQEILPEEPTASPALIIDPNAGELITPTPAPTEPGVAIDGWSRITVPANSLEAAVSLYNPEDNEGWYYLTYELRLKETGEVIFNTGLIPPGLYCNKVTLARELEKGSYPAVIHVQPYRMNEERSPTNNIDLELLLVVE